MATRHRGDVVIVGGGVAGRAAGIFTARHGLGTSIVSSGSPLLRRNAHLENYPGFPAGVNSRLLLDMMRDQAERVGCRFFDAEVTRVDREDDGFVVRAEGGEEWQSAYVIVATKNEVGFLQHLDGLDIVERGKKFLGTDRRGRTGIDGLYAAGRVAQKPHQAIVNAGHGAEVAVTLLEDDERPFYHDWVAPERYFTGRDRDVPPGCEEIEEHERLRREQQSIDVMREYFSGRRPDTPEQHPNVLPRE